ncbi:hypothetical protein AJ80_03675 [Polytolypa hystricis UAMH7299]|uniref:Uncharacterized protein n=1 Tax=Polytolypa hystricis (strain UAMH7299) TaxID=1447883 RepID=A0A2B7YHL1_POLH7|nr:hypothetical protein AJ80_03675 [Polytolypa hystricis UAMH7299]
MEEPLNNVRNTINLLARILNAKIEDEERLVSIFRSIPVVQDDPNWRCPREQKAVGTSELDWKKIEAHTRQYVGQKTVGGRYVSPDALLRPKPTWDMIENKESVP